MRERLYNKAADKYLSKRRIKKGDRVWADLKNKLDEGLAARRPFEQKWLLCIAFLAGRQYTFFNSEAHIVQELSGLKGRRMRVDNILMPKWRRQVADLIKNNPRMSVVPNSVDDEDIKAAKTGDKVLKHFWRDNGMKKKTRQLASWVYATGNAFLDDRWNRRLGPAALEEGKIVYEGDADVGVWSPLEIVVPCGVMGAVELDSFPWLIKCKWRTLDYLRGNYKRGKEVVGEQMPTPVTDLGLIAGNAFGSVTHEDGALLLECYIQPNEKFPKGAFITGANGIILAQDEYPFHFYHLNHFKDIDIPGVFWGRATVNDALPLQVRWNQTLNSIDEYNRVCAKGKLLVPRGANIEVGPDDTHGEQIHYKPVMGHKPEPLDMTGLPPTYELILSTIKVSLEDLFSQHEVSRGTNRSDIRSGEMVEILREQDAHGSIPSHLVYEEGIEQVMGRVLKRIQAGYKKTRMIKTVGRGGEFDIAAFLGADLRGNTDVSVKRESSLPESRVAREAQVMLRFEKGLYGDPADPEVRRHVADMVEDAVVQDTYSDVQLDETLARWENDFIAKTERSEGLLNTYDNHSIHNKEHNHHRKSMEYQKLKLSNMKKFLAIELAMNQHVQGHQRFIDEALQKQVQLMALQGGKQQGGKQQARKGGGR